MGLRKRFVAWFNARWRPTRNYRLGSATLLLPHDHALPFYRSHWQWYDRPLEIIAAALRQRDSGFCAIDIGANVGDTAALLNLGGRTPVLCIEGDPAYQSFLEHNAQLLGPHIELEKCFVGDREGSVAANRLDRLSGTTTIAPREAGRADPLPVEALPAEASPTAGLDRRSSNGTIAIRRLETILTAHPRFAQPQLIKLDTDGYDFPILLAHREFLAARRPALFFEYMVETAAADAEALRCMQALQQSGYEQFLVFDNFGNFLITVRDPAQFADLNQFLLSHCAFDRAIYYFDVCALTPDQAEIGDAIRAEIKRVVAEKQATKARAP
ncbi:MAG TPA: FkbM family methyltransferase [Pirellulales bacterium]|jgi:FkbM family methyltransferase|nr:FkbM family methyltransferase [Pirellulales bacterium]